MKFRSKKTYVCGVEVNPTDGTESPIYCFRCFDGISHADDAEKMLNRIEQLNTTFEFFTTTKNNHAMSGFGFRSIVKTVRGSK